MENTNKRNYKLEYYYNHREELKEKMRKYYYDNKIELNEKHKKYYMELIGGSLQRRFIGAS